MIDLKKLEDNLDKALANETKESLTNWLNKQRACINTNRNFIGIENNMDYFNISLKRVEEKRKEKEFKVVTSFGDGM